VIRTVEVRSPSAAAETGQVLRAAFHILFWSALVIGVGGRRAPRAGSPAPAATPGEVAFRDLTAPDQRRFLALQEGVLEAESRRSSGKTWPTVEALGAEGIPPFAPDPIERPPYRWSLLRKGALINYRGEPPVGSDRPALLVIIAEPDPNGPPDPMARPDELHHLLADGTLVHVTIAKGPRLPADVVWQPPFETGWVRITAGATVPNQ
jgi:hypothetical protein